MGCAGLTLLVCGKLLHAKASDFFCDLGVHQGSHFQASDSIVRTISLERKLVQKECTSYAEGGVLISCILHYSVVFVFGRQSLKNNC